MSESSPSRSILVIFVPFDGSPEDFAAKLRAPASQTGREVFATGTLPFWTWFVPNPRPRDSGS